MSKFLPTAADHFNNIPIAEKRLEISVEGYYISNQISNILRQSNDNELGGCGLVIDYGKDTFTGDTIRGFKNHQQVDVLSNPGNCDITSDVDFALLKQALNANKENENKIHPSKLLTQREFLLNMGLGPRLNTLLNNAKSIESKKSIAQSAKRLIDVNGMGSQYKFLSIISNLNKFNTYPFQY